MPENLKIVHYLNQFFGQVGGEEEADCELMLRARPAGPGKAVEQVLGDGGRVVATIICGDNRFAEHQSEICRRVVKMVAEHQPDLFVAGPAFNAGRYGVACGLLCKEVSQQLGIPVVTAMYEENPGVEMYRRDVYIVRTGNSARDTLKNVKAMLSLGLKLVRAQTPDPPDEDGYYPRGFLKTVPVESSGAARAVEMLLAKLARKEFFTEVPLPEFPAIKPSSPLSDLSDSRIALVTDGGLYPNGNPDRMDSIAATRFGIYSLAGRQRLEEEEFEVRHRGYDNSYVAHDPHRLLPVDVLRDLEQQGVIGELFDEYISTTGVSTAVKSCRRMGREIAAYLIEKQVNGVILTST